MTEIEVLASSPVVGSSRKRTEGEVISSIAIDVLFLSPPDTPLINSVPIWKGGGCGGGLELKGSTDGVGGVMGGQRMGVGGVMGGQKMGVGGSINFQKSSVARVYEGMVRILEGGAGEKGDVGGEGLKESVEKRVWGEVVGGGGGGCGGGGRLWGGGGGYGGGGRLWVGELWRGGCGGGGVVEGRLWRGGGCGGGK